MSGSHGDQLRSAFDEVFCPLLPRLYRRAALLAGSHAAEDAVHEVYLKLVAGPQRFLAHPEPYAYAFAALVSTVRDAYRRGSRQVLTAEIGGGRDPGGGAGGGAGGAADSGWDRGWDGGFEARAAELEAVRLLGRLTVQQAAAVILVDLDGYTIDQAAEILRLHRGTVSRARLRALDKLRGTLGGGRSRIAEGHQDHAPQSTA